MLTFQASRPVLAALVDSAIKMAFVSLIINNRRIEENVIDIDASGVAASMRRVSAFSFIGSIKNEHN